MVTDQSIAREEYTGYYRRLYRRQYLREMSPAMTLKLQDDFDSMDTDSSGEIDWAEFLQNRASRQLAESDQVNMR